MKKLPHLPVGDASFESIRQNNFVYVDKTRHIYQLVDRGKYYFLSRPRRFGKSLTVSTLKCLFQGRRELFEGLWVAENTDWEWQKHPVILLDFNQISHDTPENLKISLEYTLRKTAEAFDVTPDAPLLKEQFKELILALHERCGMPVVILIDEYDKPVIEHLGRGPAALETAKAHRDLLKYFLGVLKGGDVAPVLRLVFITGVSKFSRVSIFSELNNLTDLTLHGDYADLLGYTRQELETCFADHIAAFAAAIGETPDAILSRLEVYYDGYRFSKPDIRVYNPFSVLRALEEKDFKHYWFETGTPTFLINLLREKNWYLPEIEHLQTTEAIFSVYEIERLQPEALLFQTGYVTIKDVADDVYTFGYPNREVKRAFLEHLLHVYTGANGASARFAFLAGYLEKEQYSEFIETISAIYASIPYTLEIQRDEAYFHTLFYLMVSASGVMAHSEVLTCKGRIDLVVELTRKLFIIEFKCNQSAAAALQQIREKQYAAAYQQRGKPILLMGINFDAEQHNIGEWLCEKL